MLYRFMVKHRQTGNLVEPIEAHADSVEQATEICWEEIGEGIEEEDPKVLKTVYELVPITKTPKQWMGAYPTNCDLCKEPLLKNGWVDGKTSLGPWGNMCVKKADGNRSCYQMYGPRMLGLGLGQRYDGNGWKVEG